MESDQSGRSWFADKADGTGFVVTVYDLGDGMQGRDSERKPHRLSTRDHAAEPLAHVHKSFYAFVDHVTRDFLIL
jgi:predicted NAD/FAD-dependent oxidoreductase